MREWIVTNGLGSYASLTSSNQITSKFHGLLIASLKPPTKRWLFLSNIHDTIKTTNNTITLTKLIPKISHNFFPTFHYTYNNIYIEKTIFMPYESNTTIIKYHIKTRHPITILHDIIINSRHFYELTRVNSISFDITSSKNNIQILPNNISDQNLNITINNTDFYHADNWIDQTYEKDRERHDTHKEFCYYPGYFEKHIPSSTTYFIIASLNKNQINDPLKQFDKEIQRKKLLLHQTNLSKKFEKLILASDQFIVKKGDGKSVIAGYHWFGDWGRDTLIALPGLTLVTKRYNDAKQILQSFSKHCQNGLIPNVFLDKTSHAVYNTVDASLWFIDRVFQYYKYTQDIEFLTKIWDTLESIIHYYQNGTKFNIHMDTDYLISHDPGLTWMDVKIGEYFPTPRAHKAVEIQALWYNALNCMSIFSKLLHYNDYYSEIAQYVKQHFNQKYDQLYDILDTYDVSLRPNMIFLVSLDHSMIPSKMQEKIIHQIQNDLLTIFGLRTLSPKHPNYKGSYVSAGYHRDEAYHNGTVWPWLLGPFIKGFIKVKKHKSTWQKFAYQNFLLPMFEIFGENWDGAIYEIFDGDTPFLPQGCISQAWSVAEILRTWVEDIDNIRPKYEQILLTT